MIKLYTWKTPNGRKPAILLEELGVPYEIHPINIGKKEQFDPAFLKISPNNKIPGLVDEENQIVLFESGAILTYLADKYEKFLAPKGQERFSALEWTYWQVGGTGPMLGQLGYFAVRAEKKVPEAIERFTEECQRLLGVMERRLKEVPYLAGEEYSIADMASYPWIQGAYDMMDEPLKNSIKENTHTANWLKRVGERPAVKRGMKILED